jgi:hypothetical protein
MLYNTAVLKNIQEINFVTHMQKTKSECKTIESSNLDLPK